MTASTYDEILQLKDLKQEYDRTLEAIASQIASHRREVEASRKRVEALLARV
jgi:uncharacterized coiled-coil protein SlyX